MSNTQPTPVADSVWPTHSEMLDTRAAAAFLGVAASSLEVDRCRRRWGISYRKIGRRVVYSRADLVAFLDKCRVAG
jgi:hypothetical protein